MQSIESSVVCSRAKILLSLLKCNPFGKLTTNDLNKYQTPSFSVFIGSPKLYLFPASQPEAAARVQENVRQFNGNYIYVFFIFILISLYKQPIPFLTLLVSFPLTDYLDKLIISKGTDHIAYPIMRCLLFLNSKLGLVSLLMRSEVVIAFFSSLLAAYLAMLLHGALRKLRD